MSVLRHLTPALALLVAGPLLGGHLEAQDLVRPRRASPVLVPYAGGHSARSDLLTDASGSGGWHTSTGLLYGLRLEVPMGTRVALAGDAGYATIPVEGFGSGYQGFEADASFLTLTARAVFKLTAPRSPISLSINAGGGMVRHWIRSPYPRYSTWPTAVTGLQLGVPLSRAMNLSFLAESHFYRADLEFPTMASAGQQDWRFGVGFQVPLR